MLVECKRAINASRALLVLERFILKSGRKDTTVHFGSVASYSPVRVLVECKWDLNASRALLVLEHNIKKKRCPRRMWYCGPSVPNPTRMVWLSAMRL